MDQTPTPSTQNGNNNRKRACAKVIISICTTAAGPCHHGIAHCRVSDAGDGLQIWRVAASILNSYGQPTRGGPPALGLGEELRTPHRKNSVSYEMLHR
jgi:hypothetical protein